SVVAALPDPSVRLRRSVTIRGVVRSATAGARVERQQRVESEWVGLDRTTVTASGRFRFEVTPRSPGRKQYRVVALGGEGRVTATSPVLRLVVR
nr:hypothetical protein [Actinomycetota bacterium]